MPVWKGDRGGRDSEYPSSGLFKVYYLLRYAEFLDIIVSFQPDWLAVLRKEIQVIEPLREARGKPPEPLKKKYVFRLKEKIDQNLMIHTNNEF